ncbi:MAG: beta-mannosidase [Bacteroidetes bacterium]|nr:beta-mannosidase [Bacteroidota bacterium]
MSRKKIQTLALLVLCFAGVFAQNASLPSDVKATKETVSLYKNLQRISAKGFLFGHQDDLAYGVHWRYQQDSSDVKSVTGDYPALYGWDLSGLESDHDKDIDGVPFEKIKEFVKQTYQRGAVNTFSWHSPSPLGSEKNAWDTTHGTVASILPGGINHDLYRSWLDKIAVFISSLKGNKGETIPVLFRPFHELTGTWFWWCRNACSAGEFKTLWRFTADYLRNEKHLHNLLMVYNASGGFETAEKFLERYPGDDMVDVLSFDTYQYDDPQKSDRFEKNTNHELSVIGQIAKEKNKLFALAETGYEQIPYATWWTDKLMKAIGNNKISYVLLWRNHGWNEWLKPPHMHYYVPFKGDRSEADFIKFYNLDNTFFEKDAAKEKLYH